jgi:hypothetical protein
LVASEKNKSELMVFLSTCHLTGLLLEIQPATW